MCHPCHQFFAVLKCLLGTQQRQSAWDKAATMPGIKQKMEMAEAESKKRMTHCESSLAHALTKLWGLGLLSARALQHLAACAVQDGLEADNLMKLASLGTWGTHKNNCHRDMLRNTCKDMSLKSYVLQVPALDSKSDPPEVIAQLHWLPPHSPPSALGRDVWPF